METPLPRGPLPFRRPVLYYQVRRKFSLLSWYPRYGRQVKKEFSELIVVVP